MTCRSNSSPPGFGHPLGNVQGAGSEIDAGNLFGAPLPRQYPPAEAGRYDLIYADPPWRFAMRSPKGMGRCPDGPVGVHHYETMSLADIKALPVADMASASSVLCMWVLDSMIPEALEVMSAWGFEFKTVAFTWVKSKPSGAEHIGTGYYTRANPEQCFLGRRGNGLPRHDRGVRQLIEAPVREHSRKPEEARTGLERLFGDVRRIEMFARETAPGWNAWGDQVGKFAGAGA